MASHNSDPRTPSRQLQASTTVKELLHTMAFQKGTGPNTSFSPYIAKRITLAYLVRAPKSLMSGEGEAEGVGSCELARLLGFLASGSSARTFFRFLVCKWENDAGQKLEAIITWEI